MKIIILNCLIMISFTMISANAQYNKNNLALDPAEGQSKYSFKNLQLFPIRANETFLLAHRDVGNYMTLREALERNKVVITEFQNGRSGGDVNRLMIENISGETLMILAGEVVQGGKQDRMIAQDIILVPGSGKKEVAVFCVEHGRWNAKKDGMSFNKYFTISSNEVRKAGTVSKDQQEVWNKVSDATQKNAAKSSTGTLAALEESESFQTSLKNYSDYFKPLFATEKDIIGIVAVSGSKILGCDMFASHELFAKHYSNLINSYATEAITSGGRVTVGYEKVKEYLDDIIEDESRQDAEIEKKGTQLKEKGRKIHISTF